MSYLRDFGNLVELLIQRHGLEVFVETGCYEGDSLRYVSPWLYPRYSCDINFECVQKCVKDGLIYHGDSREFLQWVLPKLPALPTLFWLDAHFPGVYGLNGVRWPLYEELQILARKKGIEQDVVMCDDMRVIQSEDNPTRDPNLEEYQHVQSSIADLARLLPTPSTVYTVGTGLLVFEPDLYSS